MRIQIAKPLCLGIGANEIPQCPAYGKFGRRAENRFEIAEEAREAQFGIHFPEPVGRGGGEIAEALLARADLPLRLLPQGDVADHPDELAPLLQRDLGDRQFDREDFTGSAPGDRLALAPDDPGDAILTIGPHVTSWGAASSGAIRAVRFRPHNSCSA